MTTLWKDSDILVLIEIGPEARITVFSVKVTVVLNLEYHLGWPPASATILAAHSATHKLVVCAKYTRLLRDATVLTHISAKNNLTHGFSNYPRKSQAAVQGAEAVSCVVRVPDG